MTPEQRRKRFKLFKRPPRGIPHPMWRQIMGMRWLPRFTILHGWRKPETPEQPDLPFDPPIAWFARKGKRRGR